MKVVEIRHLKADFEEVAACIRVKNTLDTTFFGKHKISFPNISNNRLINSAVLRRRSSFSYLEYANIYSRSLRADNDSVGSEYNERADDLDLQTEWSKIRQALSKALGFEGDVTLLDDNVHLHRLPDRYTLAKEDEQLNKLFFIVHSSIADYMKEINEVKKERKEFEVQRNIGISLVYVNDPHPQNSQKPRCLRKLNLPL